MTMRWGFVGIACIATAPALATTSISGSVRADAFAQLSAIFDTDTDSASATAPTVVSLNASAAAGVSDGGATITSFATVTAQWVSADSGSIDLSWGWNVNASSYSGGTITATNQSWPANWQYTFIAGGNGTFSGTYDVVGSGYKFGLNPLETTNDWTSGSLGGGFADPTGSGTFSVPLIAGHTYTMSIVNNGNVGNSFGFVANGSAVASVQWHINYSAAPEPASWALMLGGFGLVGAAIRRRRATVCFG